MEIFQFALKSELIGAASAAKPEYIVAEAAPR
jgi:hypothetical protein